MKTILKIILTLSLIGFGILTSLYFNFSILFEILFPASECCNVEHNHTIIFDLFVEISSDTGYHPEPSMFYFYFAYILGIVLGGLTAYKLVWKRKPTN